MYRKLSSKVCVYYWLYFSLLKRRWWFVNVTFLLSRSISNHFNQTLGTHDAQQSPETQSMCYGFLLKISCNFNHVINAKTWIRGMFHFLWNIRCEKKTEWLNNELGVPFGLFVIWLIQSQRQNQWLWSYGCTKPQLAVISMWFQRIFSFSDLEVSAHAQEKWVS